MRTDHVVQKRVYKRHARERPSPPVLDKKAKGCRRSVLRRDRIIPYSLGTVRFGVSCKTHAPNSKRRHDDDDVSVRRTDGGPNASCCRHHSCVVIGRRVDDIAPRTSRFSVSVGNATPSPSTPPPRREGAGRRKRNDARRHSDRAAGRRTV